MTALRLNRDALRKALSMALLFVIVFGPFFPMASDMAYAMEPNGLDSEYDGGIPSGPQSIPGCPAGRECGVFYKTPGSVLDPGYGIGVRSICETSGQICREQGYEDVVCSPIAWSKAEWDSPHDNYQRDYVNGQWTTYGAWGGNDEYWTKITCHKTPTPVDVCSNIDGNQETVPEGYSASGGVCTAIDQTPIGFLDSASCSVINGWSIDKDTPDQSIGVHIYKDGPAGQGVFVTDAQANIERPDVNQSEGVSGNHGFSIATPDSLKDGVSHTIYVYGMNSNPADPHSNNGLLGNSGSTATQHVVNCAPPVVVTPAPSVNVSAASVSVTAGGSIPISSRATGQGLTHHGLEVCSTAGNCPADTSFGNWVNVGANNPPSNSGTDDLSVNVPFPNAGAYYVRAYASNNGGQSYVYVAPAQWVTVTVAPVGTNAPATITSFTVSTTSIAQGQTFSWSGTAVKGSANIARYRAYVVGSQGGVWTTAENPNSISFNNPSISTAQNANSFYNGVGSYTLRFEVEDANGLVAREDRTFVITAPVVSGPTITAHTVSATSTTIGQTFSWSGSAVKGSADIARYRAFVVGSQGGVWTAATDPNSVSFNNPSISTAQNANSFYNGAGSYTLRFEVEDVNGLTVASDRPFTVLPPGGGTQNNPPVITAFNVAPISLAQGGTISMSGSAMRGTAPIVRYRAYVVGSQGGAWIAATSSDAVSFSDAAVSTAQNPLSFFGGAGTYTLRFEVEDQNGLIDTEDRTVTLTSTGGGTGTSTPTGTFTVTPTSGLTTSEAGATAAFTVVLNAAPIAHVTFPVASSDTTEGTIGLTTSLVFSPSNWNVPQTVVVTGVDDAIADGNVAYSVVIGTSTSSDINWNGVSGQTVSLTNTDNEVAPQTGNTGGGSGGGGGGGGGGPCFGFNCPSTTTGGAATTTIPNDIWIILDGATNQGGSTASAGPTGPEQVCPRDNFIQTFLRIGRDNNPNEVRKLKYFLNTYEGANLPVDGVFDTATESAVKALQAKYAGEILAPWGVTEPTGIVYLTTTRYINRVFCSNNPDYRGDADIKDILDNSVLYPTTTNPEDFEGVIGQATTTPPDLSNIAGVFGSLSQRLRDALKDIPWYQFLILILIFIGGGYIMAGAFKKDIDSKELYLYLIRGASVLAVGTVLNVLNTVSFILSPSWFTDKTGLGLSWLLSLDAINLLVIIALCLGLLVSLYRKIARLEGKV
ncbi:MAG: peptidoglycan-binding protein [Candidatus Taylorbacteria bacterium]|nr:peptidoglycan-binding protein [Candidatus Taylorbacteria bacterium]